MRMRPDGSGEGTDKETSMKSRVWAVAFLAFLLSVTAETRADGPPPRIEAGKKVYVPLLKSDRASRNEALRLTELFIKAIERETPHRVVGSPEDADLIIEVTLKPGARPAR